MRPLSRTRVVAPQRTALGFDRRASQPPASTPGADPINSWPTSATRAMMYHHLDLTLEEATRRIPATVATLEQDEQTSQRVIMRGYASDLAWLAHFLAGLRCPLAVVSPPELRDHLLALAEHIRQIVAEQA